MQKVTVNPSHQTAAKIPEPQLDLSIRNERKIGALAGSVKDAACFSPLRWPESVFGNLASLRPTASSEYGIVRRPLELARYLVDVGVPSVPGRAPSWLKGPLASLFFHQSEELDRPEGEDPERRFTGEEWFFINGILTNKTIARTNAAYLVDLFKRPIRILWNSTDGLELDLLECADEKLGATGEDVNSAFEPLVESLVNPRLKRVVVIGHSQGTLICAVLLRLVRIVYAHTMSGEPGKLSDVDREAIRCHAQAQRIPVKPAKLKPVTPRELAKLEVYCFANCATDMKYIDPRLSLPRIESFGNEHDLVARLGMLAPHPHKRDIRLDGPRFRHDRAWGHLLNAHYLIDIDRAQRRDHAGGAAPYVLIDGAAPAGTLPRLFAYLDGAEAMS